MAAVIYVTKQLPALYDSPDRPALTPAQLQAGVEVLCDYDPLVFRASEIVERMYFAITSAGSTSKNPAS